MRITVNGEAREVGTPLTVGGLLELLGLGTTLVAVERNGEVVVRALHATTGLDEGDVIEVVHFVGGG